MTKNGSAGAGGSRTFWDVTVTAGIPFSRWGALPFIIVPIAFPVDAVDAARSHTPGSKIEEAPHPFELALGWKKELAEKSALTKARIAAREGLSRARVTQIMNLLALPDSMQSTLVNPPEPLNIYDFSERRLRLILTEKTPERQVQRWDALVNELRDSYGPS
jgi:hypothetical protein